MQQSSLHATPEYNQAHVDTATATIAVYIRYIMLRRHIALVSFIQPCSDRGYLYTLAFTQNMTFIAERWLHPIHLSLYMYVCVCVWKPSHTHSSLSPFTINTVPTAILVEYTIVKSYCNDSYGFHNGRLVLVNPTGSNHLYNTL